MVASALRPREKTIAAYRRGESRLGMYSCCRCGSSSSMSSKHRRRRFRPQRSEVDAVLIFRIPSGKSSDFARPISASPSWLRALLASSPKGARALAWMLHWSTRSSARAIIRSSCSRIISSLANMPVPSILFTFELFRRAPASAGLRHPKKTAQLRGGKPGRQARASSTSTPLQVSCSPTHERTGKCCCQGAEHTHFDRPWPKIRQNQIMAAVACVIR